jgi:hypothetical protein
MAEQTPEEKAAADAAAEAAAQEAAEAAVKAAGKSRKVRVLLDIYGHKANDVISLPAAEAADAVSGGWADDDKAAVAYAEKLAKAAAVED